MRPLLRNAALAVLAIGLGITVAAGGLHESSALQWANAKRAVTVADGHDDWSAPPVTPPPPPEPSRSRPPAVRSARRTSPRPSLPPLPPPDDRPPAVVANAAQLPAGVHNAAVVPGGAL